MRFWDSSATVPLVIRELTTTCVRQGMTADAGMLVWWATEIESVSAIRRAEREKRLTPADVIAALQSLTELRQTWQEIEPAETVRQKARQLLAAHSLRAADALQLAAAHIASNQQPATLEFVCLDDRLAEAARREGFPVLT